MTETSLCPASGRPLPPPGGGSRPLERRGGRNRIETPMTPWSAVGWLACYLAAKLPG